MNAYLWRFFLLEGLCNENDAQNLKTGADPENLNYRIAHHEKNLLQ
jgi:hypothetical protein